MNKYKKVRMTFTLPENIERDLREMGDSTGLKLSKIVEKGIILFRDKGIENAIK